MPSDELHISARRVDVLSLFSDADEATVHPIIAALRSRGFGLWDRVVPAGHEREAFLEWVMRKAPCILSFWSQRSSCDDGLKHDARFAWGLGKMVAVKLDHVEIPLACGEGHSPVLLINWSGDQHDQQWGRLISAITQRSGRLPSALPEKNERWRPPSLASLPNEWHPSDAKRSGD